MTIPIAVAATNIFLSIDIFLISVCVLLYVCVAVLVLPCL
jgi:hypothetical protein